MLEWKVWAIRYNIPDCGLFVLSRCRNARCGTYCSVCTSTADHPHTHYTHHTPRALSPRVRYIEANKPPNRSCHVGGVHFTSLKRKMVRSSATIAFVLASVASASWGLATSLPCPSLSLVETALMTTAKDSFNGHAKGFEAAARWDEDRLKARQDNTRAPHLVCAEYSRGREVIFHLKQYLSSEAIRPVSHSNAHGACFFVSASHAEARAISGNAQSGQLSIALFPSALKVAPGVLDHGASLDQASQGQVRLTTTHGHSMRMSNVEGLNVELSPGTLPAHSPQAGAFTAQLLDDLMSESIDLHATNVWSDPSAASGEHLTTPEGVSRRRDWSRAAKLVHELSVAGRTSPAGICSWDGVSVHHAATDLLLVSGGWRLPESCVRVVRRTWYVGWRERAAQQFNCSYCLFHCCWSGS